MGRLRRHALSGLVATVAVAWTPCLAAAPPDFVLRDVAAEAGITWRNVCGSAERKRFILEENGSGAALFDYDGDGDLDLYLVNGSSFEILDGEAPPVRDALYRNDGAAPDGTWRFVDVTERAGLGSTAWGFGVAAGDVDGDGDDDLYVGQFGPNRLYRNRGDGTFVDITEESGTAGDAWSQSAAFADFDGDGDLDLYVANNLVFDLANLPNDGRPCDYRGLETACGPVGFPAAPDILYLNDGGGRFTDISIAGGIREPEPRFGLGTALGDLDDDGRVDLYVANDSGPNFLFRNLGPVDGVPRFEEIAFPYGVAMSEDARPQAGMGVDAGDLDGDLDLDLFVTNFSYDHNTLYRNLGGFFQDITYPSGLGGPSRLPMGWGTRLVDLDHDGDLDLYVANGHIYPEVEGSGETFAQADQLFLNRGDGRFVEASERILRDGVKVSRGVAFGDIDLDGDLDAAILEMGSTPSLLRNEGGAEAGAWIAVESGRPGACAEGVRVLATAAGVTRRRDLSRAGSYGSSSEPRAHFGLGAAARVERIELRWADGRRRILLDLPTGRRILVR